MLFKSYLAPSHAFGAKHDPSLNGEPSLGQPVGGAVRAAPVQAKWETVARSIRPSPFADKPSHWQVAALAGKFLVMGKE